MKKYEQMDISGDAGLRVWGHTLEELFVDAAEGMSELITDTSLIEEKEKKEVSLISDSIENLFIQWLNELIFLFDTYGFIGKQFVVDFSNLRGQGGEQLEGIKLSAKVLGGIFNQELNECRLLIKAATYHDLSIRQVDSYWEAAVIFDI